MDIGTKIEIAAIAVSSLAITVSFVSAYLAHRSARAAEHSSLYTRIQALEVLTKLYRECVEEGVDWKKTCDQYAIAREELDKCLVELMGHKDHESMIKELSENKRKEATRQREKIETSAF